LQVRVRIKTKARVSVRAWLGVAAAFTAMALGACAGASRGELAAPSAMQEAAQSAAIERRVARILASMTLPQKVGQMTQADIRWVTPEDVRRYYLGSVLSGGGAWPGMRKHAPVEDWIALSDAYYRASMSTDMQIPTPVIWGVDAVHGHNNVFGATLFPHNIGLGAAHDPSLVSRVARSTARAMRATAITWDFAPTLAVVQDQRWGRTYESFSSDPALVRAYAAAFVRGLQHGASASDGVLASAKHFLGDGGTLHGRDQGVTAVSEDELLRVHAPGYLAALEAGAQTVMVSYSSWDETATGAAGVKMHANRHLITDMLKVRWGFDGFVVSDWNAIEQIHGCTRTHCPEAINAGVDMVMVPEDWRAFIEQTVADVERGDIPMARIDDAVSRILRVKLRAGLFDQNPAGAVAGTAPGAIEDRELAREAVRASLVLLKDDRGVLPLSRQGRILVVGKGADSFAMQSGGWSRTWQGDDNPNEDFGTGETLLSAVRAAIGAENVVYSELGEGVDPAAFAAIIAVLAERPYAEGAGDVRFPASMAHSARYPEDIAVLRRLSGHGTPVVTVLYSGRTVYADDLFNLSDAFVAAWLPGTEAGGITDVLFRAQNGNIAFDFSGALSFAWPGTPCESTPSATRFPVGYGLRYARPQQRVGQLPRPLAEAPCLH